MQRSSKWRHASSVEWPAAALRSTILPGFNFGEGPVFVLTHRLPDAHHHPAITFLSDDLGDAVATAKDAAAGKAVIVFGANLAAQCLRAGLLDEIVIHLVPILLGDGVRLIGAPDLGPVALERKLVATSGQITDLRFAVRRSG